ncbi:50S ribosomal protein L35 [bacterium]|nr:50S ribosomal protein L35 [bacterium]
MPKVKTRKSMSKRIKVTGSGKLMRNRAGGAHLQRKKSASRKIKLRQTTLVSPSEVKKVKQMLPGTKT